MLSKRLMGRWRPALVAVLLVAVTPSLTYAVAGEPPAVAAPRPVPPKLERVKLGKTARTATAKPHKKVALFDASARASLPGAQTTTIDLSAPAARSVAGATPIKVSRGPGKAPDRVRLQATDQKTARAAGIHGLLFSVGSATGAGTVRVDVDPSTFANAYGGGYASRLRLVRLPGCALTTPKVAKCRTQTPVATAAVTPLTAQVSLAAAGATVLAATSGTSGSGGDYSATSLSPGGTWSTSGNTGAFAYSYPIAVPPPIGALTPSINLSYSSASQDARTVGTNSQSSWIGDGWSMGDNFIERTYRSCDDVDDSGAPEHSGDLCWAGQILTLSLNGESTPIVYDDKTHTFHSQNDSSTTQIDNLFTATNGTKNNEYFRVTQNGTQYYFGLNRLPGWTTGAEETNSVQTVPVYKGHKGVDACPDGSFADTSCKLGYRFNLDYAVDRNGNAMAYYYNEPEIGYYGANMKDTAVPYVRASTIKRIDYGMTSSTVYSAPAPEQVIFTTDERCIAGQPDGNTCADDQFTVSHPAYWPDVPVDLNCTKSKDCTNHSPSFWTRRMLTTITTRIRVDGAPKNVDRYDLKHSFPDNGDHEPTLWLQSVTRTGLDRLGGATTDASAGTVSFDPQQYANRVGVLPGPRMYYNRIHTVWSETGAETVVEYDTPKCEGLPPANPSGDKTQDKAAQQFASTNTTGCFPVYWAEQYQPEPLMDWFYTHPVTSVTTYDSAGNHMQDGSQPKLVTRYAYQGKPGWHYDDNEVVKKKNRTWGQFRGYPEVDVIAGDPAVFHLTNGQAVHDQKTLTKSYYFLGMDGDTLPDGKTRDVPELKSTDGSVSVPDRAEYAGQTFESVTYTGAGTDDTIDSATVTVPTVVGTTASRARDELPALHARMTGTAKTLTRKKVSYGWRRTETDTLYNTTLGQSTSGRPVQTVERGETGAAGNTAKCTFTSYTPTTVTLPGGKTAPVVQPSEVINTDQDCATRTTPSGTLLSDVKTTFDTKGNPAKVEQASAATGTTVTAWVTTAKSSYDSYGRVASTTRTPDSKAPDNTSLAQSVYTKITPASGALPTAVTSVTQVTAGTDCSTATKSSKDCQLSTVTLDPARGVPTASTDVAGALTSVDYDALGRTTSVWMPNRSEAADAPANVIFEYKLAKAGPSVVTTKSLLEDAKDDPKPQYGLSKTLYDALLRPLETQHTGENGSTTVSDTQYDSHGWTVITNNNYVVSGAPVDVLLSNGLSQVTVPSTTVTDHDAMGRVTQLTTEHDAKDVWHTRTAYNGDKATTVPPTGAIATTTTLDARGRLTELVQHTTAPTLSGNLTNGFTATGGVGNSTKYAYNAAGQQTTVTGPDNAVWSDTYDLLGRQIQHNDPDTGISYSSYDDAGNLTTTKDARGVRLGYTYDLLGRKLTAVDKSAANFKFASWTYDTLRIGKPTSSTRYVPNVTGNYTVATTGYTVMGQPLGQTITLPSVERPLPLSYTTKFTYTPNTELLATQQDPAVGTLPGEKIVYDRDALGAPTKTSGIDLYVSSTTYGDFGQPSRITMGDSTNQVEAIYDYDKYTLRLQSRTISRKQAPGPVIDETGYMYDDAGNPLSVVDKQSESGNTVTDAQCYRYDTLARLTEAWTAASACPEAEVARPAAGQVANRPGAYWQTFGYKTIGDRDRTVEHSTAGGADATTKYTYGTASGAQPHTLTETAGGGDPTKFVYDLDGNLLTRTASSANNQTLKWDDEGNLASVTTTGAQPGTTKYLYDANGLQLIRRDPGRTSLFAGDTEVVVSTAVNPAVLIGAVRHYAHGGAGAVAVRSTLPGGGAHYLFGNSNGTANLAIDTTTQDVSRQQYKPYGENRAAGNTTLWPDLTHGYLGAPKDISTGYTDVGARKYDPGLGRFISADPLLETTDPAQLGGYAYAGDNPITNSDPSGLRIDGDRPGCARGNGGNCGGYVLPDEKDPDSDKYQGGARNNGGSGSRNQQNPVDIEANGNGVGSVGGITVTVDQVDDVYAYGQKVNYAYFYFRATQQGFDALDDNLKMLKVMDWACQQMDSICNTVYATAVHNAINAQAVKANGGDPERSSRLHDAVSNDEGGSAAAEGKMLASTRASMSSFDELEEMAQGVSSACVRGHSFSPETRVLLADGTTKPISQIQAGDQVLATDPTTGTTRAEEVTELHVNEDTELVDLTVDTADGQTVTLHTTSEHPFWSPERQKWVDAGKLKNDQSLGAEKSHGTATVREVHAFPGLQTMYNLTVADLHTYYVLAGKIPVLVHNTACGVGAKRGPKPAGTGPHNLKIETVGNSVTDGEVIAGGGVLPERAIPTPGGFKGSRRPDILVRRPDGSIYGINVGKQAASGAPIKREAQAISDLEGAGVEMHFVPYN
ncbi:polymorphic toxin-type HINT domain-containing protein [Actinoplanes sp. NPDC049681]|uniref:polymorphic toxin-type HINT domain-containing protein n=1 Tax=Actinoplanes sp. NPDC049681 TaxID=3363905 RepID=UPI0037AC4BC6